MVAVHPWEALCSLWLSRCSCVAKHRQILMILVESIPSTQVAPARVRRTRRECVAPLIHARRKEITQSDLAKHVRGNTMTNLLHVLSVAAMLAASLALSAQETANTEEQSFKKPEKLVLHILPVNSGGSLNQLVDGSPLIVDGTVLFALPSELYGREGAGHASRHTPLWVLMPFSRERYPRTAETF
jgi:hypothetical protein